MIRNIKQLLVLGTISIDGQAYQAILVKLFDNCSDGDWVAYVRRHLRHLELVPAKDNALEPVTKEFHRGRILRVVVKQIAALGELSRDDKGHKVYPVAVKNVNSEITWHPDQWWRIRHHYREEFHYLGLRPINN